MRVKTFLAFCVWLLIQTLSIAASEPFTQDLRWRLVGPMRAGWSSCAEGIPDEPGIFYFGAVDGGVWKTTDNGITWKPISDHAPFSSVGTLAITQTKPHTIYVGTGHVDTRYDVMDGNGVYKSSDDGQTWISLGLKDTQHIGKILIDPHNPDTLLVAALGHLFGPNSERGVFRSNDGGKTWQKFYL
jgi:BNR/Asp-box repeat.